MADKAKAKTGAQQRQATAAPPSLIITIEALRILNAAIWPFALVLCVYFGITLPVRESAGKLTIISVAYRVISDIHVLVPYTAAGTFFALWRKERKTRVSAVAREHRRVEELERQLDPDRTSSGFEDAI